MPRFRAGCEWTLPEDADFPRGRYSRAHTVRFGDAVTAPATASPHVVGSRWADPAGADPEQMLVGALSSCHMLSFLHVARLAGHVVRGYRDQAEGVLETIGEGRAAVTRVILRPDVEFAGDAPDAAALAELHHAAHHTCFIANSVRTQVTVEPQP